MAGTGAQLVALAIVVYDMVAHAGASHSLLPGPSAATAGLSPAHFTLPAGNGTWLERHAGGLVGAWNGLDRSQYGQYGQYDMGADGALPAALLRAVPERALGLGGGSELFPKRLLAGEWAPAVMAVLNLIFAYGGQFAYLEIMTSMKVPRRFASAVGACTGIMTALYGAFGAVGYWSKGASVHGIVIFNMRPGRAAQVAAGFIFFQALAQYLVNLNVWAHNLLTLLARRKAGKEADEQAGIEIHCNTGDHKSSHWLLATAFVAAYSAVIAVAVPFFCTLVGLVTSVTYLTCAYTLPAWFALRLLKAGMGGLERAALHALIPLTLAASAVGLVASVKTYIVEASGGEGM